MRVYELFTAITDVNCVGGQTMAINVFLLITYEDVILNVYTRSIDVLNSLTIDYLLPTKRTVLHFRQNCSILSDVGSTS